MLIITVSFQQISKLTESVITMQDAILALYAIESNPNKQQKVNKAVEKIQQSKDNLKTAKPSDSKRKSNEIVESKSETEIINNTQNRKEIKSKKIETNFYEGVIGDKDYLQYCIEQTKTKNNKQ